jgi:hypothetical protein
VTIHRLHPFSKLANRPVELALDCLKGIAELAVLDVLGADDVVVHGIIRV